MGKIKYPLGGDMSSTPHPTVLVVDDFYDDPLSVREMALAKRFVQYSPAPPAEELHFLDEHPAQSATWWATSSLMFRGRPVGRPFVGERYNPRALRNRLAVVVGEAIDKVSWDKGGDGWNGAFHLITQGWMSSSIHHHHRSGDIDGAGWSGVLYLSPDAPPTAGTTIWRDKETGRYSAPYGPTYDLDMNRYDLLRQIDNRYNRLLLIRENVLHRGEHGFGLGLDARLTQTFFFRTDAARGELT